MLNWKVILPPFLRRVSCGSQLRKDAEKKGIIVCDPIERGYIRAESCLWHIIRSKTPYQCDPIVQEFTATLRQRLGSHLRQLLLFGSRARGDAQQRFRLRHAGSDGSAYTGAACGHSGGRESVHETSWVLWPRCCGVRQSGNSSKGSRWLAHCSGGRASARPELTALLTLQLKSPEPQVSVAGGPGGMLRRGRIMRLSTPSVRRSSPEVKPIRAMDRSWGFQ